MNDKQNSSNGGFSLVEVVIAIVILSFGLLAMAASTGYVASQLRSSSFDTQRNLARQQVIEQLRSTIFANLATNTAGQTVGRYTIRWNVTLLNSSQRRVQIITQGPAYRARQGARTTVTDTASITILSPL
jgi:prepilin-type N-terminal cleavage/methylation domain-containing protein